MVQFAVSAITDEFSPDLQKVCEYFQSKDVGYVELRTVMEENIAVLSEENLGKVKDILSDTGMKVSCLAGPLMKCHPPSENPEPGEGKSFGRNWQYNFSTFPRLLELADALDSKNIRCFGFSGHFTVPPVASWDSWNIYQEWKAKLTEFKAQAKQKGKTLVCENEGGLTRSYEMMYKIGQDNADAEFGLLFDTANVVNQNKKEGILTDDWLEKLAPYTAYVHAKGDRKFLWFYSTTYVNGKGDLCRWPTLLKKFRNMEKSDFITAFPDPLFLSIETHMGGGPKRWERSAQSMENLLKLVQ